MHACKFGRVLRLFWDLPTTKMFQFLPIFKIELCASRTFYGTHRRRKLKYFLWSVGPQSQNSLGTWANLHACIFLLRIQGPRVIYTIPIYPPPLEFLARTILQHNLP